MPKFSGNTPKGQHFENFHFCPFAFRIFITKINDKFRPLIACILSDCFSENISLKMPKTLENTPIGH
jgi:hypothetical protein